MGECKHNFIGEATCEHCGAFEGDVLRAALAAANARVAGLEIEVDTAENALDILMERTDAEMQRLSQLAGIPREQEPSLLPEDPRRRLRARAEAAEKALAEAKAWSADDKPIPEDEKIKAAHPTETKRYRLYDEAVRMVSAKRSKYALVDLVNWLLVRIDDLASAVGEEVEWRVEVEHTADDLEKQLATISRLSRALVDHSLPPFPENGVHYCRGCDAGTHNDWVHASHCRYVEWANQRRSLENAWEELRAALESQAGQAGEKTSALDDTLAKLPAVPARPCDQCGRYDIEWWGQGIGCNHCVGPKPPTDFFERLGEKPSRVVALPSASATAAGEEKSK